MTIWDRTTSDLADLSEVESARLRHKESVIERSAEDVAAALAVIRDERLYRAKYATFEAYCRDRWGMTHRHVNRQIIASEVAAALGPIGPSIPESQARELSDLRDDPERMRQVYQDASDATGGNVTAASIRAARAPWTVTPADGTPQGEAPATTPAVPSQASEEEAPAPAPRPAVVGIDGKTYPRPEPKADRAKPRKPLPDVARDAGWDLRKSVERLERIAADDRFATNKPQVAPLLRSHLENAVEVCQDLLARIDN